MRFVLCASLLGVLAQGVAPGPAVAQETRAAAIAQEQAAKSQKLVPYEAGKAERIALKVKETLIDTPDGFYPWFDSVYSGGGFTLGGGYRRFLGDRATWDARGLYSFKSYKRFEVATNAPGLAGGPLTLSAIGGWRDATQVAFYGVGGDTTVDAKSNFRMQQGYVGAQARVRGRSPLFAEFGTQYDHYTLESGTGSSPSIETIYDLTTAPGLGANPKYLHSLVTGGIDTRLSPGYARRGGLYAVTYDSNIDVDGGTYSFDRVQAEVVQHIPILRENWVISLHGVARTTLDDESIVPYFLLASLGSGSTLRAYPSWRFRDRHSLLLSGEWRWIPNRMFLDMAFFYDTGKVASRVEDLNFSGMKSNVGVGFRIHSPLATPLRIDLAHGSEGMNLVFSGAAAF